MIESQYTQLIKKYPKCFYVPAAPGCPGDCHPDTQLCYTLYNCIKVNDGMPFHMCTNITFTETNPPVAIIVDWHCEFTLLATCYVCTEDTNPENVTKHYVHNDTCQ